MTEWIAVITITLLAVISPGPDFAMVTRNSLLLSRRAGVGTALGIALAQLVQMFDPSQVVVILDPALKESVFGRVLRQEMETHVLRRAGVQTALTLRGADANSFAPGAARLAGQHYPFGRSRT